MIVVKPYELSINESRGSRTRSLVCEFHDEMLYHVGSGRDVILVAKIYFLGLLWCTVFEFINGRLANVSFFSNLFSYTSFL